jgi:predicted amidohydrolase
MTTSYYPGGGVMIATEPGTIYAELDAQDKLLWDRSDPDAVARIERELLRRGLDQRKDRYRLIEGSKKIVADGMIAALRERYGR